MNLYDPPTNNTERIVLAVSHATWDSIGECMAIAQFKAAELHATWDEWTAALRTMKELWPETFTY